MVQIGRAVTSHRPRSIRNLNKFRADPLPTCAPRITGLFIRLPRRLWGENQIIFVGFFLLKLELELLPRVCNQM